MTAADPAATLQALADRYRELAQAIPPAYTEWLGARLLTHLEVAA